MRKILPQMNNPTLNVKLGDSLTAEQIINAVKSGKWTPEEIIMRHNFGVIKLCQHFDIDPNLSTNQIKNLIVDKLNAIVESPHKPK